MDKKIDRDSILAKTKLIIARFEEDVYFREFSSDPDSDTTRMLFWGSNKASLIYVNDVFQKKELSDAINDLLKKYELRAVATDLGNKNFEIAVF